MNKTKSPTQPLLGLLEGNPGFALTINGEEVALIPKREHATSIYDSLLKLQTITNSLFALAMKPAGARAHVIDGDLIDQDQLVDLQDQLAGILDSLDRERLYRLAPHLYRRK